MSKKKKNQSISMEDHCKGKGKNEDYFDRVDYEVSSVLLQLSHPVVFSSSSSCDSSPPLFHKWGRTKKRSSSSSSTSPVFSPEPLIKSVGDLGSNSSSSCLTGEAKKTNSQTIKKGLEEEFCTKNQTSSQFNTSCSVLEAEMGLLRAQVGFIAQPIRVDQNLRHMQPSISVHPTVNVRNMERRGEFDLNLPAVEEGNGILPLFGFERVAAASKLQAAAQARQRRLGLIRSKKLYTRFISSYQLK